MKSRISDLWAGELDDAVQRRREALVRHIDAEHAEASVEPVARVGSVLEPGPVIYLKDESCG